MYSQVSSHASGVHRVSHDCVSILKAAIAIERIITSMPQRLNAELEEYSKPVQSQLLLSLHALLDTVSSTLGSSHSTPSDMAGTPQSILGN